ncbi:hypothetical protein MXD61_23005 [Frankia sp. AgPm24]|uniref:hypothetical protein n=1 Tax=Frankia sp. AgPm24 TaxID=631128 RepID=UPI00200D6F84|nr:hypothetical protein [Frankia sp. AgPm24]MCK9924698.1 hypothetical protein [Frankia sp. AgPm24]
MSLRVASVSLILGVTDEAAQIEQTSSWREIDEEIDVARVVCFGPGDEAEDTDIAHTVALRDRMGVRMTATQLAHRHRRVPDRVWRHSSLLPAGDSRPKQAAGPPTPLDRAPKNSGNGHSSVRVRSRGRTWDSGSRSISDAARRAWCSQGTEVRPRMVRQLESMRRCQHEDRLDLNRA